MSDNLRFEHSGTVDEKALEQNDPKVRFDLESNILSYVSFHVSLS